MSLHNTINVKRGLSPAVAGTDNTAYVSQIVNRAGYEDCEFIILIGANTDADVTFTVLVEDGAAANLSDAAAVDDAYLLGTEALAGFQFDDDNEVRKIGYKGPKQYVRVTITPANNAAGNIYIAGVWLLAHGRFMPAANPPT